MMVGRQQAYQFSQALAEFMPKAFASSYLVSTGSIMGIRESRRIIGEYQLVLDDYLARRTFDDEIARSSYFIDIHNTPEERDKLQSNVSSGDVSEEEVFARDLRYKKGESHGIPYRCLVPKALNNVLVAGKTISADHAVKASIRVMPVCLVTGQAAGTAAHMAAKEGVQPREVDVQQLRAVLRACSTVNQALSVRLYVDSGKLYANENEFFFSMDTLLNEEVFSALNFQNSFMLYCEDDGGQTEYSIICVRLIRSLSHVGKSIGAIATTINEQEIWDTLKAFEADGRSIFLLDSDLRVLSCADKRLIGTTKDYPAISSNSGKEKITLEDGRTVYFRTVGDTNWYIACEVYPEKYPGHSSGPILLAVALSILMLISMGVIFSRFIARAVSRVTVLSNVFNGETVVDLPVTHFPLFKQLDEAINNACQLVKSGYEQMQTRIKVQLQLLQMQINPHFLYNSLDTVLWLVRKGDIALSEKMINAMSRYLRLILNNGNDIVSLADEIELMQAYVDMQRISCSRLNVEVMLEAEIGDLYIPKQTLQPIIENAILHGIMPDTKSTSRIDVLCYVENDVLYIVVTDNGVGMPKETVEAMSAGFVRTTAYGLYNVDQRIKLFSGRNDFGISIASTQGQSTTVTMKIAAKRENGETRA